MRRIFLIALIICFCSIQTAYAAKLPDDVKKIFKQEYPTTVFRFDGLITLPDGTLYLPLFQSYQ